MIKLCRPVAAAGTLLGALALAAAPVWAQAVRNKLNDTGVTQCRAVDGTDSPDCAGSGQDGEYGRDVSHPRPRDGRAGFAYVKIAGDGSELPAQATGWTA